MSRNIDTLKYQKVTGPQRDRDYNKLQSDMRNMLLTDSQKYSDCDKESSQNIRYTTNYVKVKVKNKYVYKYSVTFSPDIDSTGLRYKLLCQHDAIIGPIRSFDGMVLYVAHRLPEDSMLLESVIETSDRVVVVKVKLVNTCEMASCHQLIGIIFKRLLKYINLQRIGRGHYCPELKIDIDQYSLSLWPGYNTSLRSYQDGLMWNIDTSFKMLRKDCALDIMSNIFFKSSDFQRDCIRSLVGSVVITRYNNKTYRIDDISWDKSPKDTFEWQNGQQITYIEYYRQIYGLEIMDTDQPLLINLPKVSETRRGPSRNTGREPLNLICLIPEFCFLTGITNDMRSNFGLMKDISRHIHSSAAQRMKTIQMLVDLVHKNAQAKRELDFWGLELSTSLHEVTGHNIKGEALYDGSGMPICDKTNGSWNNYLKNFNPISCPTLENWICVHTERDTAAVERFMGSLEQAVINCNLNFNPPRLIAVRSDNTENYIKVIKNELAKKIKIDLIMCVFPSQREDRYASFKKLLCCQTPVPSQAVLTRTISDNRKMSTVANRVALQINCKLGGELWRVHIPMKGIMVIGIDVYHCTFSKSKKSVAGLVNSLNDNLTQWYSRVSFQAQAGEMVESLRLFTSQALAKYYEVNHQLPRRVIVFRDGIGDGQLNAARELEINHLHMALRNFSDEYDPELLYILVRKRINTRFVIRNSETGEVNNPLPGSVIDNSITTVEHPNFFLVSQNYTQGTVMPINLVIAFNSSKLSITQIQKFSYKCTYLYYNWSGTVRVPAPCLYAHKVAYMTGQYLQCEVSPVLSDKLYYL